MPYVPSKDRPSLDKAVKELAKAICDVSIPYGYDGAFLGELNYSLTRLIQEIPKEMVTRGVWKEELRYWIYAGMVGVLVDVKDEYKRRVNPSYEAVQILKSGDAYDTPYRSTVIKSEGVDAVTGETVTGWQEIMRDFRPGQKAY